MCSSDLPFFKKSNPNTSRPPSNSSAALNVEEIGKDNFCSFHQAAHSEKMCPQWIGSMTALVNQLLDDQTPGNQTEDDVSDPDEGSLLDGEPGSSVLTFDIIRGGGGWGILFPLISTWQVVPKLNPLEIIVLEAKEISLNNHMRTRKGLS